VQQNADTCTFTLYSVFNSSTLGTVDIQYKAYYTGINFVRDQAAFEVALLLRSAVQPPFPLNGFVCDFAQFTDGVDGR